MSADAAVMLQSSRPATLRSGAQIALLCLAGVLFEQAFEAIQRAVPRRIFQESSFTWALLERKPAFLVAALLALVLLALMAHPRARRRLEWKALDTIGGFRWVVFGTMIGLAWPYGAYPYNHYYDQAHLWDRGLVFFFMLASLRSPVWIPFFCLQVVTSRVQTHHAIASSSIIIDEVPLRVLAIVAGFGLWNPIAAFLREGLGTRSALLRRVSAPIDTATLVFAILCTLGAYYFYPAIAKLALGERPQDWVLHNHLENLFVGAYLNGWHAGMSEATAMATAGVVRTLSVPVSLATLLLELAMLFVVVRRGLTLLLLASVILMHLGIVALTGVFFWTWVLIDACLLAWLIWKRRSEALAAIHSRPHAILSVVLIATLAAAFGSNPFTWWNTKWHTMIELDAVGRDGSVYRIDYSDFYPFLLTSFWAGYGPSLPGSYGGALSQDTMHRLETADPTTIKAKTEALWRHGGGPKLRRDKVEDFMRRFFVHYNRNLDRSILRLPPYPTIRMRDPRGGIRYEGQTPVAAVRVRYVEKYFTGGSLFPLRDEVIQTVSIPAIPEFEEDESP